MKAIHEVFSLDDLQAFKAQFDAAVDGPEVYEKRKAEAEKALRAVGIPEAAISATLASIPAPTGDTPERVLGLLTVEQVLALVRLGLGAAPSRIRQATEAATKAASEAKAD